MQIHIRPLLTAGVTTACVVFATLTGPAAYAAEDDGAGPIGCAVQYETSDASEVDFSATVTIANTGDVDIEGWTLTYTMPQGQTITEGWDATVSQSGSAVTATSLSDNGYIVPGDAASFGYQVALGTGASVDGQPSGFTLNGVACSAGGGDAAGTN